MRTGTTTVTEVAPQHDLTPGEIERSVEEGISGMANNCRARTRRCWRKSEEALIQRFDHLGLVPGPLVRSDNDLAATSQRYTATVSAYGLQQAFITPHSPAQNGLMERFNRSLN